MNIITLSTIPKRFGLIHQTLESLLQQTADIDRIILYIPKSYRRFPDYDGTLPAVPEGVDIEIVDEDLGPATKVLPAIRAFKGQDVNILFCDDDRDYQPDWAATLLQTAKAHPGCAVALSILFLDGQGSQKLFPRAVINPKKTDVAYRLRRIWSQLDIFNFFTSNKKPNRQILKSSGYADICEGVGGVLVRPEFFDELTFDIPAKIWAVDDVWLSGHLARKGIPIWANADFRETIETHAHHEAPLYAATLDGLKRDEANAACVRYFQDTYDIWK